MVALKKQINIKEEKITSNFDGYNQCLIIKILCLI